MKKISQQLKLQLIRARLAKPVKHHALLGKEVQARRYNGIIDEASRRPDGSEYFHVDIGHGQGMLFVERSEITVQEAK